VCPPKRGPDGRLLNANIPKWDIAPPTDVQLVEILGRNRLISELLQAGLEVALPIRDRGIDLIAYADLGSQVREFTACPIQMKASSARSFSIAQKYGKFPNLILAYVWGLAGEGERVTYALTQTEAVEVGSVLGWTSSQSWQTGLYTTQRPGNRLLELLAPYRMTSETWRQKVLATSKLL